MSTRVVQMHCKSYTQFLLYDIGTCYGSNPNILRVQRPKHTAESYQFGLLTNRFCLLPVFYTQLAWHIDYKKYVQHPEERIKGQGSLR